MVKNKVHKATSSHVVNETSYTLEFRCEPTIEAEGIYDFKYSLRPSDASPKSDPTACAYGHVILRDSLGESRQWYTEMDAPSDETAQLSRLFDSRGRLLEEHISNPYLRGTGVWGHELSKGSILLITVLEVEEPHRRQGIATWLLNHILSEPNIQFGPTQHFDFPGVGLPPRIPTATCPFAMAWPSALVPARLNEEQRKEQWAAALKTFRGVGFRRIGRTVFFARAMQNTSHPSLSLPAQDDADEASVPGASNAPVFPPPDLSPFLRSLIRPEWTENGQRYPLHAMMLTPTCSDEDIIDALSKLTTEVELAHIVMPDPTGLNATPLHCAAMQSRASVIEKLLSLGARENLSSRTTDGLTPLDHLQRAMREQRAFVMTFQVRSWSGFSDKSVRSQAILLEAMGKPVPPANAAKWGCTCGQCVDGWFSPRMRYQIHVHGELAMDMSRDTMQWASPSETRGHTRLYSSETLESVMFMEYIPKSIRDPGVYATFINGYSAVFGAIARVTNSETIPTTDVVLRQALESDYFDAQAVRFFFNKGGRVEHALNGLLHHAREQGPGGDGSFLDTFGDDMDALPTCENDEDYVLLRSNLNIPANMNGPISGSWTEPGPSDDGFFGFGEGSSDEDDMEEDEEEDEDEDEEME